MIMYLVCQHNGVNYKKLQEPVSLEKELYY